MKKENILIPRFDTHGDIILLSGFLRHLVVERPHARVLVIVRDGYDELKELFPERIEWQVTSVVVGEFRPNSDGIHLKKISSMLSAFDPDVILFTTYNLTWIDWYLISATPSVEKYSFNTRLTPPEWISKLLKFNLSNIGSSLNLVKVEEKSHECEKYAKLWRAYSKQNQSIPPPRLRVTDAMKSIAAEVVVDIQLADRFAVCNPAGSMNVKIKSWGIENFARLIHHLRVILNIEMLLIGHMSEEEILHQVRSRVRGHGSDCKILVGGPGDFTLIASIVEKAEFYLGNDTGPMHLAAALGVPIVAFFGGGHWPRFIPVSDRKLIFVREMVCFYCDWNCPMGDAPCISQIAFESVVGLVHEFILNRFMAINQIVYISNDIESYFIGKVTEIRSQLDWTQAQLNQTQAQLQQTQTQLQQTQAQLQQTQAQLQQTQAQLWQTQAISQLYCSENGEYDYSKALTLSSKTSPEFDEFELEYDLSQWSGTITEFTWIPMWRSSCEVQLDSIVVISDDETKVELSVTGGNYQVRVSNGSYCFYSGHGLFVIANLHPEAVRLVLTGRWKVIDTWGGFAGYQQLLDEAERKANEKMTQITQSEAAIANLLNSPAWKIGNIVMWPYRKFRKVTIAFLRR